MEIHKRTPVEAAQYVLDHIGGFSAEAQGVLLREHVRLLMAEVTQLTAERDYWRLSAEAAWERDKHPSVCPESEDKIHCDHWRFDYVPCCDCGKAD